MAQLQYIIACAAVVLFLCVQRGESISCYVCNSHNDTSCADTPPPEHLRVDCGDEKKYILCRKIKQVIDFEVNGLHADSRIIRSCGWYNESLKNHCYQRSGFGGRQEVCACDKNYCNTSTTLTATATATTSMAVLAIFVLLKLTH